MSRTKCQPITNPKIHYSLVQTTWFFHRKSLASQWRLYTPTVWFLRRGQASAWEVISQHHRKPIQTIFSLCICYCRIIKRAALLCLSLLFLLLGWLEHYLDGCVENCFHILQGNSIDSICHRSEENAQILTAFGRRDVEKGDIPAASLNYTRCRQSSDEFL